MTLDQIVNTVFAMIKGTANEQGRASIRQDYLAQHIGVSQPHIAKAIRILKDEKCIERPIRGNRSRETVYKVLRNDRPTE